jgi:serine/threonine protein phosphatase 1
MRTLVIGDIHGGYRALLQCLKRSGFDYEKDRLISLGDIVDGWPETPECIEELLKIKNLMVVMGNHDKWFDDWVKFGSAPDIWTSQGGQATLDAYLAKPELQEKHRNFFNRAPYYFVDDEKRLFIHGGFQWYLPIEEQSPEILMWDRGLAIDAMRGPVTVPNYKEVYLGHTTTSRVSLEPIISGNVILMDQGGGWEGKLSIMDVETKEFWQSDVVNTLYPGVRGRD